jgi:hypothetical protein
MGKKMTHESFLKRLAIRKDIRLLKGQTYTKYRDTLRFKCDKGHIFNAMPQNVLVGKGGCTKCLSRRRSERNIQRQLSVSQFVEMLNERNEKFKDKEVFLSNESAFINRSNKAEFECKKKHKWLAFPNNILIGRGCPKCKRRPYSKVAIMWMESLNKNIQHAENGGEFRIPGTNYFADGYDKSSNTIYEFHGDAWHGNPELYQPSDKCHPYDKQLTAQTLYKRTQEKENIIKQKGFNLITIWENDWKHED